jgi:hypothetical protein
MTWEERDEQTYEDKSSWERGEWDNEPDRIEWRHNGRPCLIVRNNSGALCGYASVAEGHPRFGQKDRGELDCHGGVTYEDFCVEGGKICHVPKPGEPDRVWWFGFDCAHSGEYSAMAYPEDLRRRFHNEPWERYCSVGYVRRQVEQLAEQLDRIGRGEPAREE